MCPLVFQSYATGSEAAVRRTGVAGGRVEWIGRERPGLAQGCEHFLRPLVEVCYPLPIVYNFKLKIAHSEAQFTGLFTKASGGLTIGSSSQFDRGEDV
jgi:hypothetical protein